jgi:glycosyltransferase involved in cell wall biosynthesis
MRILQVIPLFASYRVFLRELTEALVEDGHTVLTVCDCAGRVDPAGAAADGKVRHLACARGADPRSHLRAARALRAEVDAFRPDIVHAHFSAAVLTAALARRRGKQDSARWFGTFQGLQFPMLDGPRGWLLRRAEAWAAGRMDAAWVLTDDDAVALRRAAPRAVVRVQDAPGFGCADRFFDTPLPQPAQRARARAQAGYGEDAVVFLFIGRLAAFKGFHLALRACMAAHARWQGCRLLVIGEPDPLHPGGLDAAELQAMRTHAAIRWLGAQEDVLPWLDIADALLFPTTREGMPVSVMEALARRLPVLTNPVRGCRELVQEGVNGYFFSAPTEEAVRQLIMAFQPFRAPVPSQRLRRSRWIAEVRANYAAV